MVVVNGNDKSVIRTLASVGVRAKLMHRYLVFAFWEETNDGSCGLEAWSAQYDTLQEIEDARQLGRTRPDDIDFAEEWANKDYYQVLDLYELKYLTWKETNKPLVDTNGEFIPNTESYIQKRINSA